MQQRKTQSCSRSGRLRWFVAASTLGFIFTGCASPLSLDNSGFSFKEARLENAIAKEADADPFPTPAQAGIRE